MKKLILILLLLALNSLFSATERPNIILMMADDLGYETVSANGGAPYKTPVLDKLAAEGLRFTNCVAQPLCTPTRVKVMTGRYSFRNYVGFGILDPRETTFGNLMRDAGYATCITGKWQLGRDRKLIDGFGFDEYCLWWLENKSARYNNVGELIQNGEVLPGGNGEYGPDVVSNFMLDFITRHKDEPFFCYYPMILTHNPFELTPDSPPGMTMESPELDRMAGMVAYTDKIMGRVVDHLETLGIRDNTVILFIGDNGTNKQILGGRVGKQDWPGAKGSNFVEMGMRVPLIVSYPAGGVSGAVYNDPVDLSDFLPTFTELGQAKLPKTLQLDGHSFAGRLTGDKNYTPHPWAYVGYYGKKRGNMSHFARDIRFKLYEGGYFYDFVQDPQHAYPIDLKSAGNKAKASYKKLSAVLEDLKSQIPAGDEFAGNATTVIATKPGMQNVKR
ncbi:sulfatase-like hydrolase/transferase [Opitutia bacterium ISCC 51]|nr:sulfatase-like hydrolase/transferase [Opitutae bacterium ISCC 51]QXD26722.1 sulfatase-like hydrolase/transferase [Opitutae bacterium ISCC 52]